MAGVRLRGDCRAALNMAVWQDHEIWDDPMRIVSPPVDGIWYLDTYPFTDGLCVSSRIPSHRVLH